MEENLMDIAKRVREDNLDCYDNCKKLEEELKCKDDILGTEIEEIILPGEYRHYVILVHSPNQKYLIDMTFDQFESGPIEELKGNDLEDIVVSKPGRYILNNYRL